MFRHTSRLQFESKPDQPDPVYAHKLQELIGGAHGEMTVTMPAVGLHRNRGPCYPSPKDDRHYGRHRGVGRYACGDLQAATF
jgi:hypothetical protein